MEFDERNENKIILFSFSMTTEEQEEFAFFKTNLRPDVRIKLNEMTEEDGKFQLIYLENLLPNRNHES